MWQTESDSGVRTAEQHSPGRRTYALNAMSFHTRPAVEGSSMWIIGIP